MALLLFVVTDIFSQRQYDLAIKVIRDPKKSKLFIDNGIERKVDSLAIFCSSLTVRNYFVHGIYNETPPQAFGKKHQAHPWAAG